MTARIERRGRSVVKRVGEGSSGEQVAAWSRQLSRCGVPTPPARYDARTHSLRFPWISGTSSGALLARALAADTRSPESPRSLDILRRLFGALVCLHGAAPEDLHLEPIDPWRRVRPRLAASSAAPPSSTRRGIAARAQELMSELLRATPSPGTGVPVHGDFHVGQMIVDGDGQPWLLDLDDLSLGPPEADLGNFVAHLCTKEPFAGPRILEDLERYLRLTTLAYVANGGPEPHPGRLHWHAAVGLVRRSLKLLEVGPDPGRSESALSGAKHCLQVSHLR